ncbi:MAG: nucleoside monophosphate kinase [Nanoarchaeota archaeon]
MILTIMGIQGSGKGTQADYIAKSYGYTVLSTGEMIRDEISRKTKIGRSIESAMARGELASDDLTYSMIKGKLLSIGDDKNVLLDGFPRTLNQARMFDQDFSLGGVILLDLNENSAIKRLSGREQCSNCRAIYGPAKPSSKKGKCDACHSELVVRDDDKPQAIRKRLNLYSKETEPVVKHYLGKGLVRVVDAGQKIPKVSSDISRLFPDGSFG